MTLTYTENVQRVRRYLTALNDGAFPDPYASLRHTLLFLDRLRPPTAPFQPGEGTVDHDLTRLSIQEFGWAHALREGAAPMTTEIDRLSHKEKAAFLRSVVRSGVPVAPGLLLDQVGISHTLDSLVRDALTLQLARSGVPDGFETLIAKSFRIAQHNGEPDALAALLDIGTALEIPFLDDETIRPAMRTLPNNEERLLTGLIRHLGALHLTAHRATLEEMLMKGADLPLGRYFALVNAVLRFGGPASERTLTHLAAHLEQRPNHDVPRIFQDYVTAALQHLRGETVTRPTDGLVIAQFMFQGRIGRAGKGNSGGLGVFLGALGDAMAQAPGVAHVYTLVLLNATRATDDPPLMMELGPGHTVLHVPLCCRYEINQYHMMVQEIAIQETLTQLLATYNVHPDVFHVRYSDHGSRVAARVAHQIDKAAVFTLTTDPHRRLTQAFPEADVSGLDARALTVNLHKVYLTDQLIDLADGLIAMPHSEGTAPLQAYFPQLTLDPAVERKPLRQIAEGIRLLKDLPTQEGQLHDALAGLCTFDAQEPGPRLALEFENRPIMLNVGRLHPIKQQDKLVQAWAESGLWRHYNLVLIGGNLEDPSATEREMQNAIETTFERYPDARGRFCFLPAMPNAEVRRLEAAIIAELPAPLPHVYACSSVKEEFGIAVLEAMDAGFLACGPQVGGLSSYIASGNNGFLVDTSSAERLGTDLREILLSDVHSPTSLKETARRGQRTIRERFDIVSTAARFVNFYQRIDRI